jgi:hypothetical protein
MMHLNPFSTLSLNSIEDVDKAARVLSEQWERSFSPAPKLDGKKKAKLRDMVCNLAGYTNGFKSFMDSIRLPVISSDAFDMPDELMAVFDHELNYLYLGSDTSRMTLRNGNAETLHEDSEDCFAVLYHDPDYLGGMDGDKSAEGVGADDQLIDIFDIPRWQYLIVHYEPVQVLLTIPRIEKYGVSEEASPAGMQSHLKGMGLLMDDFAMANALATDDRGDDGSDTFAIHWRRKSA